MDFRDYLHHDLREGPDLKRRCRDVLAQTATLREGGLADGASPLPGQFTRLCTALIRQRPPSGLPSGWHSVLNAADRADGPRLHVDLDTALLQADGTAVRLNTLESWPGSWDLYLQALTASQHHDRGGRPCSARRITRPARLSRKAPGYRNHATSAGQRAVIKGTFDMSAASRPAVGSTCSRPA